LPIQIKEQGALEQEAFGMRGRSDAKWMGISGADLPLVMPNLARFARSSLEFMA
jgi:hypothetical protein